MQCCRVFLIAPAAISPEWNFIMARAMITRNRSSLPVLLQAQGSAGLNGPALPADPTRSLLQRSHQLGSLAKQVVVFVGNSYKTGEVCGANHGVRSGIIRFELHQRGPDLLPGIFV